MAKDLDIKTKSVSFNLKDEWQKGLYDHASSKTNFSNYVKRLIDYDMRDKKSEPSIDFDVESLF